MFAFMLSACMAAELHAVWSWETQVRSEYIGRIGVVFYDKPLLVNDITLSYGDFNVGVWNSTGLGGQKYGSTFADETDLYVGWGHTYDWIRFQVVGAYFFIKDLDNLKNDLWIVEPEISLPKVPFVQPYLSIRSFNQVTSESPGSGWFTWVGLRRTQPLGFRIGQQDMSLKFDLMAAYSDGALGKDPGPVFGRLTVGMPVGITKHLTAMPSILWQTPIDNQEKHRRPYTTQDEVAGYLSFRWVF